MNARFLLLPTLLAAPLMAGDDWAPIGPDVWAMKEAPEKGIKGAVVLEHRVHVDKLGVNYVYRVRILSEAGKAAAEFNAFPSDVTGFSGRTVYPDGKVLPYNSAKDFQKKTQATVRDVKTETVKMIAPGLTSDCVVDLRWTEPQNFAYAGFSSLKPSKQWRFTSPYPARKVVVEVPLNFPLAWNLEQFPERQATVVEKSGFRILTWTDLPADEDVPYSLLPARKAPVFTLFKTRDELRIAASEGAGPYWKAFAGSVMKPWFDEAPIKGGDYKAFLADITAGLPAEGPQARAKEILSRLHERIVNYNMMSHAEKGAVGKLDFDKDIEYWDLKAAVKRKGDTALGIYMLYYHLLKDAGIPPRMVMVTDRESRLFNFQVKDSQQFTDLLFGVAEAGKPTVYIDAGLRFATPGLMLPNYQGSLGLEIDTASWKVEVARLPIQPAEMNQRRFVYKLDLQEDEDLFAVDAQFTGYPDFSERREYLPLEATEQQRHLKERLEEVSRAYVITKTEVVNTTSARNRFGWRAEGRIERAVGRRREVLPFPGMAMPLWIPSEFPPTRTETIVLPYARIHRAESTFKIPKGYSLGAVAPYRHSNGFGRVEWSVDTKEEGGETVATVTLLVRLDVTMTLADAYPYLKEYLGWVREASGRTLLLEKL